MPLLDRLRQLGALSRTVGNATITAYQIIKAREDLVQHSGDPSAFGYFAAAHTLVQIRADLHRHGVGVVRTKLARLRTEPQKGVLSNLVKSPEFEHLWDAVIQATYDVTTQPVTVQDKLINNPKLTKLVEVLTEHFERARVSDCSSRAIVFSQFRDSVSEIVEVLSASSPVIRPRHFVGQGSKTDNAVKGMKQAEQHEVIQEFRSNVYNVLVCTCK
jgi:ERCC4-related helicase